MAKAFVSLVSFLLVCAPLVADAQLHEMIGIRAQGMGGAFVAVADDATTTWWNPAGLASGAYFSAILEVDEGGGRGFAVAYPALGLSYYRLRIRQIRASGSTAGTTSGRQDQGSGGIGVPPSELVDVHQFGATTGQSLGNHFVVASTLKLVRAQSDTVGDLDLGAMAKFGALRVGLSVRNVRAPEFGADATLMKIPRQAHTGVALTESTAGAINQLTVAFDADLKTTTFEGRETRRVASGAEAWVLGRRIGIRGGAGTNTAADTGSYFAGGLSVAFRSGMYLDAATTGGSDQAAHRWGVDLRLMF